MRASSPSGLEFVSAGCCWFRLSARRALKLRLVVADNPLSATHATAASSQPAAMADGRRTRPPCARKGADSEGLWPQNERPLRGGEAKQEAPGNAF